MVHIVRLDEHDNLRLSDQVAIQTLQLLLKVAVPTSISRQLLNSSASPSRAGRRIFLVSAKVAWLKDRVVDGQSSC